MTDRIHSITIVLEKDMRVDDAEAILTAVRQLRGVIAADGNVTNGTEYVIESRIRRDFGERLWHVLYPPPKK